jgi:hypothetical protein
MLAVATWVSGDEGGAATGTAAIEAGDSIGAGSRSVSGIVASALDGRGGAGFSRETSLATFDVAVGLNERTVSK